MKVTEDGNTKQEETGAGEEVATKGEEGESSPTEKENNAGLETQKVMEQLKHPINGVDYDYNKA